MGGWPSAVESLVTSGRLPDPAFWRGRRVLLTGHTGFKGGWLTLWLDRLGAHVHGLALPPEGTPNLFTLAQIEGVTGPGMGDIRDGETVRRAYAQADPEVVLHMAAQPLVHEGYRTPEATFATNVLGTAHVLGAARGTGVRAIVAVTTDKVYHNREWLYPYRENDRLGGYDPYSASKAAAELVVNCYRTSFLAQDGIALASARAGNVVGGGDWSPDRLIPDAVRAWLKAGVLEVRHAGATRPWQHVLEPLAGYLLLAERLHSDRTAAGAWNFGPEPGEAATVRTVVEHARAAWGQSEVCYGDGSAGPHEAGWLALETVKARRELGVVPRWDLPQTIARTIAWYQAQADGADARELCHADIEAYEAS